MKFCMQSEISPSACSEVVEMAMGAHYTLKIQLIRTNVNSLQCFS